MIEKIENIEKLTEALGSEHYEFHDAEIVSVKFDRNDSIICEVTLQIHRRITEFEIDGKTHDRFRNFDATFRFSNVWLKNMNGFGFQNVIDCLTIATVEEEKFAVHFEKNHGCDLKFECERMEFTGVNIFETEKERYVPDIEKMRASRLAAKNRE